MSKAARKREVGRADRVIPGLWRLRLPLPWAGVPHVNAYAIAAGDSLVLVDCGADEEGSLEQLELAISETGFTIEQVKLLVCTHAHVDHYGQAAPVIDRSGCQFWMHPNHAHVTRAAADPETVLERRVEVARACGMPEAWVGRYIETQREARISVAAIVDPDRALIDGMTVEADLGRFDVYETPGHAPSHVCLFEPERRILISGDHVLGRIALYYDYGWTPDPVGEYLDSLERVRRLDARLCLSGHGRPFTDVRGHIDGTRTLVERRLETLLAAMSTRAQTAYDLLGKVYGELDEQVLPWRMGKLLCYLTHLERTNRVRREPGDPERWTAR